MGTILSQWVNSAAPIVAWGYSDDYNFKVTNMHEQSMLWDGMFVEISGQSLNDKKITLGNIYRPPRNIIDDYNTFFSELVLTRAGPVPVRI